MNSLNQFFEYMNETDFPYVVMRNFEKLPEIDPNHNDLDILVYDYKHFTELFPGIKPVSPTIRVRHKLILSDSVVYIDVRRIGDGYYPTSFQVDMLETRVMAPGGFYIPRKDMFMMGLVYHVVHHKNANTYPEILGDNPVEKYLEALKKSDMGYVHCTDPTVGRFNAYWKGATSVVTDKDGKVRKKQTGWTNFNLIDNELNVLNGVDSIHFPKVLKVGDEIEIENCGERLNVDNLPQDWEEQLKDILRDLRKYNIKHRDIRPDNFMVSNGVIKLIDFGWAARSGVDEINPPNCLGYGYRPSWGWDDSFSMRQVIKELRFKESEKCLKS